MMTQITDHTAGNGVMPMKGTGMNGQPTQQGVLIPRWIAHSVLGFFLFQFVAAFAWAWSAGMDLSIIKTQMAQYAKQVDKLDLRLERLDQSRHRSSTRSAGD